MASGRGNKFVGQVGEFLVCAELGRRGYVATPFSGNVPGFDVVAINERQRPVPIQVKTSSGGAWQFDARRFLDIDFNSDSGVQTVVRPLDIDHPELIHVFVWLGRRQNKSDRFFVLTRADLQATIHQHHVAYLNKHGGRRPKRPDSLHRPPPRLDTC